MPTPRIALWSLGLTPRAQIACDDCPPIPLEVQFRSLTANYVQHGFANGGAIWLTKTLTYDTGGTRTIEVSEVDGSETITDEGDVGGTVSSTSYSDENTEADTYLRAVALADAAEGSAEWLSLGWGGSALATISGIGVFPSGASQYAQARKLGTVVSITRIEQRLRLQSPGPALCGGRRYFVRVKLVTHTVATIDADAEAEIDIPADGGWSEVQEIAEPDTGSLEDVRAELLQEIAGEGTIVVFQLGCVVPRLVGFPAFTGSGTYRQATLAGPLSGIATFSGAEVQAAGLAFDFASTIPSPLYDEEGEKLYPFPDISLTQPDGTSRLIFRGPLPMDTEGALGDFNMRGWRIGTPAPDALSATTVQYGEFSITLFDPWGDEELPGLVDDYFSGGPDDYLPGPLGDLRVWPCRVGTEPVARRRPGTASWIETRAAIEWRPAAAYLSGRAGTSTDRPTLTVTLARVAWDGTDLGTGTIDIAPNARGDVTLGEEEIVWIESVETDAPDAHRLRPAAAGYAAWVLESVEL